MIGEHPLDLLCQRLRIAQPAFHRHITKLVVRDAAPEEEGETRRELDVADAIRLTGRHRRGLFFDPVHEPRRHQDAGQRLLDPGVEVAGLAALRDRTRAAC